MNLLEAFDQALRQWQMYMEDSEQLDVCDIKTPEAEIFKECLSVFEKAERASRTVEPPAIPQQPLCADEATPKLSAIDGKPCIFQSDAEVTMLLKPCPHCGR